MFTEEHDKVIHHFSQDIDSSQEITNDPLQGFDWNQKCTISEIKEKGINLTNQIHLALVKAICVDIEEKSNSASAANQVDSQ